MYRVTALSAALAIAMVSPAAFASPGTCVVNMTDATSNNTSQRNGMACGMDNQADGMGWDEYAIAYGVGNIAFGRDVSVWGQRNDVRASWSTVVGTDNVVEGGGSPAQSALFFGDGNVAQGGAYNSTAIGNRNVFEGGQGVYTPNNSAVGNDNTFHGGSIRTDVFGSSNEVTAWHSTIIGSSNNVVANDSLIGGSGNDVRANWSLVMGYGNIAENSSNREALVLGYRNEAHSSAVAIGTRSYVGSGSGGSIAFGTGVGLPASAEAGSGSLVGNGSGRAVAIGSGTRISDNSAGAVAFGADAQASGTAAIAFGSAAAASGAAATAIGDSAIASTANSLAIGSNADVRPEAAAGIAIGTEATSRADDSIALGQGAATWHSAERSVAIGSGARTNAVEGVAIGYSANVMTDAAGGVAVGGSATSDGVNAIALGTEAMSGGFSGTENSVAIGTKSNARATDSIALGRNAGTGVNSVGGLALGTSSFASGEQAMAFGSGATAGGFNSMAIGQFAEVSARDSIAFGSYSKADGMTLTGQAFLVGGIADAEVSLGGGSKGAFRRITNLAAGADDTDAVNVAQLRNMQSVFLNWIGGGAGFINNEWVNPTFNVQGGSYYNVGDAFAAIDLSLTNIYNKIDEIELTPGPQGPAGQDGQDGATGPQGPAGPTGPQGPAGQDGQDGATGPQGPAGQDGQDGENGQDGATGPTGPEGPQGPQGPNGPAGQDGEDGATGPQGPAGQGGPGETDSCSEAVCYDDESRTTVTVNQGGNSATITNVAEGVNGTDAVNVNQLNEQITNAINTANSYTDQRIEQVYEDMWDLTREARAGTASAMAMAGLPQAYMPGKSMAAVSASSYHGEQAIAVGVSVISESGRYVYKVSGSGNTAGDAGVTFGAGIQW